MAQVMEDGAIRFLSREEVVEELAANPEAEIYDLDGKRLELREGGIDEQNDVEVTETGERDRQALPPAAAMGLVPDEKIAYAR